MRETGTTAWGIVAAKRHRRLRLHGRQDLTIFIEVRGAELRTI